MSERFRVVTAAVCVTSGEMCMYSKGFTNIISAFNYAFNNADDFVSFRDNDKDITIYDIDALTAYHENMMI